MNATTIPTTLNINCLRALPAENLLQILLQLTPKDVHVLKQPDLLGPFICTWEECLANHFIKQYSEEDIFFRAQGNTNDLDAQGNDDIILSLTAACLLEIEALKRGELDVGILQKLLFPPSLRKALGTRITEFSLPPGTLTPCDAVDWQSSWTSMEDIVRVEYTSYRRAASISSFRAHWNKQCNLYRQHGLDYCCLLQSLRSHIDDAISTARALHNEPRWQLLYDVDEWQEDKIRGVFMTGFREAVLKTPGLNPELGFDVHDLKWKAQKILGPYYDRVFGAGDLEEGMEAAKFILNVIRRDIRRLEFTISLDTRHRVDCWEIDRIGKPGFVWLEESYYRDDPSLRLPRHLGASWTPEAECWIPLTEEDCEEAWKKWGAEAPAVYNRARLLGLTEPEAKVIRSTPQWKERESSQPFTLTSDYFTWHDPQVQNVFDEDGRHLLLDALCD